MAMTTEFAVEIPDDVQDNVTQVSRIMDGRLIITREGSIPVELILRDYRRRSDEYGLTTYEFDTIDPHGHRITVTWFANINGSLAWVFVTDYYTHVPCSRCPYRWAVAYVVFEQDGVTLAPAPVCSIHLDSSRTRVDRAREAGIDLTLHTSEPLRINRRLQPVG